MVRERRSPEELRALVLAGNADFVFKSKLKLAKALALDYNVVNHWFRDKDETGENVLRLFRAYEVGGERYDKNARMRRTFEARLQRAQRYSSTRKARRFACPACRARTHVVLVDGAALRASAALQGACCECGIAHDAAAARHNTLACGCLMCDSCLAANCA